MPIYQAYNKKSKAWVKYEFTKRGIKILDVKERMPMKKFADVPIRGKKKKR